MRHVLVIVLVLLVCHVQCVDLAYRKNAIQAYYINVKDAPYNAAGDGIKDDTSAFQNALNAVGNAGGGIVSAPTGNYLIAGILLIPTATALQGVSSHVHKTYGDPSKKTVAGTTLLAYFGVGNTSATPFITLIGHDSGIEGLQIFYPKQTITNPPVPYPYTIQCGNAQFPEIENIFVKNVLIVNPYSGIDLGTYQCPRHWIENVYGQPLHTGIMVDQCYDIGRITHIHFWPFWTLDTAIVNYTTNNAVTFALYRTDWEVIHDVFSWGYKIGMLFDASKYGACNGQFSNINFDNVDIGIDVHNTQKWGLMFSNLNLANAGGGSNKIGIRGSPNGQGTIVIRGASFWGEFKQNVVWQNAGLLTISDSLMLGWSSTLPCIQISSGRVTVTNNFFQDLIGNAVTVEKGADRVMITGNDLTGNTIVIAEGVRALNANNLA